MGTRLVGEHLHGAPEDQKANGRAVKALPYPRGMNPAWRRAARRANAQRQPALHHGAENFAPPCDLSPLSIQVPVAELCESVKV